MNTPTAASAAPERILHRLDWHVIRRLDGMLQGNYRTLFYGHGLDFADLREYQPQDDLRYIDWNVTARMNTPYVRQYHEDREVTAWFLLDLSPSMAFGAADNLKQNVLIDFVATLARLLTRNGNRVGAMLYNSTVERVLPPRSSRTQVLRLINDLLNYQQPTTSSATNLAPLLTAGLNTFKRRSLVFIISDFISEPGWERPLSLLGRRHELLAIRLWDPREVELPDVGLIVVEDSETGEQLFVDTSNPEFRRRFQEAAVRRETTLNEAVKRAGVDLFSVSTTESLVDAIVRMTTLRKQRR